jgi:hypothetical protein
VDAALGSRYLIRHLHCRQKPFSPMKNKTGAACLSPTR